VALLHRTGRSHGETKSPEENSHPLRDPRVLVRDIFLARTPEAAIDE
jgi:hypothetical protein